MNENILDAIVRGLEANIRSRVRDDITAKIHAELDRIVAEETAKVALQIGRYVSMQTLTDRIVIEVKMPK